MDQDERQRKVEAGRAKLAHYRKQRAKGDGAVVQKKTSKRKDQTGQGNRLPAQERHLEERQNDHSHGYDDKPVSEESLQPDVICDDPASWQNNEETDRTGAQEKSSVSEDKVASEHPAETVDLLGEMLVTHTSKEQLKQLQAAVEKRNEIISQLSVNLQAALMSRDQVQLEAQQLTTQIQELQQQLLQAKEYLRSKSLGWLGASQAQQNQLWLQAEGSQQKETEIAALHQKLGVLQDSLSQFQTAFASNSVEQDRLNSHHVEPPPGGDGVLNSDTGPLLQKLRTELDEERQNRRRALELAEGLQKTVAVLEGEREALEAQLEDTRAALERAEEQAREAQRYKAEKEELNRDVARLDGLVQELQSRLREEEETGKRLCSKYESEIGNFELRLQTLEEERELNVAQLAESHEAALRRLREEHSVEVRRIQELLDRAQQGNHLLDQHDVPKEDGASVNGVVESSEPHDEETAIEGSVQSEPGVDDSVTDVPNDLMERYLALAVQHETSQVEQSLDEHSLLESSKASKFEMDSEFMFESRSSDHRDPASDHSDAALLMLPDMAEAHSPKLGEMSFSHAQWQSFTSSSRELNESSADVMDLGKELLIQQCRDLTEQLEQKERQLEVLEEEVQRSAEELEEARERWSKASEELEEAKWELETEREKRLQCEEIISQKTQEQDNLKNKLGHLENQQQNVVPDKLDLGERNAISSSTEELLKELAEEKIRLVLLLKQQEQLVRDIREQKVAGDSVSSEVQALFGRQLSSLQAQRDQLMEQVENQTTAVLLGQKTLEVDSANREVHRLQAEMEEKVENLQRLEKVNSDLESKLTCLKQNLTNMEEALSQGAAEHAALVKRLQTMEQQAENTDKILQNLEVQLEAKSVDLQQMKEAKEKAEEEHMEKESALEKDLAELRRSLDEHVQETEDVKRVLQEKHQKEVQDWSLRLETELSTVRETLQEEQKKQISLIKQVHEREQQRALSLQAAQQREELSGLKAELSDELRDSIETAHEAELLQMKTQHALELEALRLSLTNLHAAQLELSQANLQKDKEAALSELQASLREKWAQDHAVLHSRQQFELERHREQERQARLQHQQQIDDLRREWEKQMSDVRTSLHQEQARKLEDAKIQWAVESERERAELQSRLAETRQSLSETRAALDKAEAGLAEAQDDLRELRHSRERVEHLETDLSQARADRDSAARAVEELVARHQVVLDEQKAHARGLEEKEKWLQKEVDRLLAEQEALKSSSEKEISNLWSQLENMRTSRQELGELKEQLVARSSRVEDVERLKQELAQQRRDLQQQNEAELEGLRTYFEQRLHAVEDGHREEIALLQLRLEESLLRTAETSFLSEEKSEDGRSDAMAEITEQLEKHKAELDVLRLQLEQKHTQDLEQLRCDMALSYREELLQARTELTDRYYSDIEQLNTKHALDIEQLRAKLSDGHLKDITKLRLQSVTDVARQVDAQLEERTRFLDEEHQARLAQLASEAERILGLEKQLAQLTLQHTEELQRSSETHTEELRDLEARLQKTFDEELLSRLEEARLEERRRVTDELTAQLQRAATEARRDLEAKLLQAQELLAGESQRLQALQASLECEETPQLLAVKQRLQDQYERELRVAKSTMAAEVKELNALLQEQAENRLQDALCRHQEERGKLEEKLAQQREADLGVQREQHVQEQETQRVLLEQHTSKLQHLEEQCQELKVQHQAELEILSTNHKASLQSLEAELSEKHKAELETLSANHKANLQSLEAELAKKHKAELEILSTNHKASLQSLEAELSEKHKAELEILSANHKASLQSLEAELAEKHKAELDKLQVVLEETNLAQLEAQEAELVARHKRETEELETRMLCNMDTLESTYLQEVQVAQEEKEEALEEQCRHHAKELERVRGEELALREQLQRDMAQVHMDKFSAMATELGHAHQEDLSAALSSQKAALEADHLSALETLQQHVLELEKQHSAALQEITDMTAKEKQHLLQQLEELKGASGREMEALRTEQQEEAAQQRLHFLEEAELLKCQSEEQLQQKIAWIKEECEQEKAAALQHLQEQHQQSELGYRDKTSELTTQLQQLDTVVAQLRAEVSGLQGELEGKRAEMSTLETLLQRREREGQEGANLLAMLRDDLNAAAQQRRDLQDSRDRLQRLLLETLRVTTATEEQIGRRLGACLSGDHRGDHAPNHGTCLSGGGGPQTGGTDGGAVEGGVDRSALSSATDEGLEVSERLCESLLMGPDGELDPGREDLVLDACGRLRDAVDKLLELVSHSTQQLEQMQVLQAVLDERFSEGGEAQSALLHHHAHLMEQLQQEANQKSQLQLELHKAEGLMEGYVAEKAVLEEVVQQKEVQEQRLAEELEDTRARLQQLEEEHVLLQRQRDALSAGLGDTEKGRPAVGEQRALLDEAERLGRERVDVQRQAEKDRGGLVARLHLLELGVEEAEGRAQQLQDQHRTHTDDLQQHIAALEKQLKHHRQFIDEQAVEREHERDEFQQEINNLEAQLKLPAKGHGAGDGRGQRIEDLVLQVESLQALVKDRAEDYNVLLMAKEQCQREVRERDEEIDKLASRTRELEQALLSSAEAGRAVLQLEQDLQRTRKSLQDLEQDKESLQQQLYSSKLQMSALQSKLDETRHRIPATTSDPSLFQQLQDLQQDLQDREQQVEALLERVEVLQKALAVKEEDVRQLTLQMELSSRDSRASEEHLKQQVTQLQETVSSLHRREETRAAQTLLHLPAALLEEKNLEIDHLNQQIIDLQQELLATTENKVVEETQAEVEELRTEVERLRGDQERLRQSREEEVEHLHEVIQKLQEELEPERHEVSDPGADSPDPDLAWSPRAQHQESLCQELSSQTLQAARARLREVQAQLERSAEEKEALQTLLLSQEEQYQRQVEVLARSLAEDRARLAPLQREVEETRGRLVEREVELEELRARVRELEGGEEALRSALTDAEVRLRREVEGKEEALERVRQEVRREAEERERVEGECVELQRQAEEYGSAVVELRERVALLEQEVQQGRAEVAALETDRKELDTHREALRKHQGTLQQEIEKLKQEVTSKADQIQELNAQLEERVTRQEEEHKDVLTCAEETLAKAETALREREEHLVLLRAEHDSLRAELAAVKEGLSTSTERADKLQEEGQTKDRALADLEVHNQHLRAELRGLQEDLALQEEELAYQQRELEELRRRHDHPEAKQQPSFLEGFSHDASLSSPEALRRLDCSEERLSRLHASRLSELSALELPAKPSPADPQGGRSLPRRPPAPPPDTDPPSTCSPSFSPRSLSVSENLSALDSLDAHKVREMENLDGTPSHSPLCSTSPVSVPEWASDGYGSNVSSELEAKLKLELEHTERLDVNFVEYLRCRGMDPAPHPHSTAGSLGPSQDLLSPELQAVLKRVYQESCRVLSLSHRPAPAGEPRPDSEEAPPPSWQRERRALQETVLSLRELLCRMAEREPKTDAGVDWRGELVQALRSMLDSERKWLHAQFQAVMAASAGVDHTSLLERLERLLQTQEQQQMASLERLLAADHSSLLAGISGLHAQQHTCALQTQEQLREMQGSLHAARQHTQQQLHTRVEELEGRLREDLTVTHQLRNSLEEKQTRGAELQAQLEVEQKVVSELRAELEESRAQLRSACKSREELQNQILTLRLKVEREEQEHQACVEVVETEQTRVKQLQDQLHQERVAGQRALEQSTHTQESLRTSLSEQTSRLAALGSELEQERVAASNLRSELRMERSRCEALLAHERRHTEQALEHLAAERQRSTHISAQLSETLSRQAQEARAQEEARAHDGTFIQDLRDQLERERTRSEELAGAVERLRAQDLQGRRRQEELVHREQEEAKTLREALEGLRAQRAEVGRSLEEERRRAERLRVELEEVKKEMAAVMEKEREREEQRRREREEQEDKGRRQERTAEKLLQLEVLHERDQQCVRQLQHTLADLEQQEKRLASERTRRAPPTSEEPRLRGHAHTQEDSSLVERVLKENTELSERLAAVSEEKVSLKHSLSCLERDLLNFKRTEQVDSSAWQKEKVALQSALLRAETDLARATAGIENRPVPDLSGTKMQRLYEKYLRAESYRKSLAYQKRYLLLLLGGFQDCEQATLALIARMGVQPSLGPAHTATPLSRFRSAVRALVAISRLKFLTRKWQRATRKIAGGGGGVSGAALRTEALKPQYSGPAFNSPPTRDHVLTQRGVASPLVTTREHAQAQRGVVSPPGAPVKSPFRLHNGGSPNSVPVLPERTLTPSQEQERSLAEYIQHLEGVQQRLGAIRPGSPSVHAYTRKSDR
ncbi:pericentrin isoform X3 [Brachyhypopomus gauderio]|uniref:pericentrin isoform X3 n=1 Tax=Brachyhypopomus gauderio TaxID=698409 RepID=UPI004042B308